MKVTLCFIKTQHSLPYLYMSSASMNDFLSENSTNAGAQKDRVLVILRTAYFILILLLLLFKFSTNYPLSCCLYLGN